MYRSPINENACCDGSQQALRCVTLKRPLNAGNGPSRGRLRLPQATHGRPASPRHLTSNGGASSGGASDDGASPNDGGASPSDGDGANPNDVSARPSGGVPSPDVAPAPTPDVLPAHAPRRAPAPLRASDV